MMLYYLSFLAPLLLLFSKHLIIDFFFQTPYMAANKGTYGHWGGISHALFHSLGSIISLLIAYYLMGMPMQFFIQWVAIATIILSLIDGIIHYHMDWFKTWWGKKKNYKSHPDLGCTTNQCKSYWQWMGIDQFIHIMTYVGMFAFIVGWIQVGMNLLSR